MSRSPYNRHLYGFGSPVRLRGDVAFTTTGGTVALTASKNRDIYAVTQLIASSATYLIQLDERFHSLLGFGGVTYGQKSTVAAGDLHVPAHHVSGGCAVLTSRAAAAGNVVTINGVAFTAVAHDATPEGNQWAVGNSADTTSATNLAAAINAATDAAVVNAGIVASVVTDSAGMGGAVNVAITTTALNTTITKTGAPITLVGAAAALKPGLVVVSNVGVTPTVFASGDALKFWIELENSSANPAP